MDLFKNLLSFSNVCLFVSFFSSLAFGVGSSFWIGFSSGFTSSSFCVGVSSLFSIGFSSFCIGASTFEGSSFCIGVSKFCFSSSFAGFGTSFLNSFLGIIGASFCCWTKNAAGIFNLPGIFFGWFCSEDV